MDNTSVRKKKIKKLKEKIDILIEEGDGDPEDIQRALFLNVLYTI